MITAVPDARTDCSIVTVSACTITGDSNDENEVCTCEAETACWIITAQEAPIVLKMVTQYWHPHGSDGKLDMNLFSDRKDLQIWLLSSKKQV
jgi:hypothetical protein